MKKAMNTIFLSLLLSIFLCIQIGCSKGVVKKTKYDDGQLKEQYYVKKDKDGDYVRSGRFQIWHENGQKKGEVHFKDGKLDGLGSSWYENGKKRGEGQFKNGKLDGLYTTWYENGQKELEINYKGNTLEGLCIRWYENGQKKKEVHFKDGILIKESVKEWDKEGTPR